MMADALLGIQREKQVTLLVANTGVEPVLLEEGDVVESLQPCIPLQADMLHPICYSSLKQSRQWLGLHSK